MAGLREAVKDYQDELRAGIAWVAFWREGRSWHSDHIYLEMDDTLTPEDRGRLREIQEKDPAAVILNGYYCGYLGEDMNLAELTAGVRRHYENSMNDIADFIEAHDNTLPPELLEEARAAARDAGLPFSEKPYRDGDFDPYVFDGSMSVEDHDLTGYTPPSEPKPTTAITSLTSWTNWSCPKKQRSISSMRNTGGTRFKKTGDSLPLKAISTTTATPFHSGTTGGKMTYRKNTG